MSEIVKDFWLGMPVGLYVVLLIAIGLLLASFILPPLGIVEVSALKAAALSIGGAWLLYVTANIPRFVESGAKIKASYGNASIEIGRHRKHQNPEEVEEIKEEIEENNEFEELT